MKKIVKTMLIGYIGLIFLSCNQGNNSAPVLLNLPIDRNVEVNILKETEISKNWTASQDEVMNTFGKNAFLVIQNTSNETQDIKKTSTEESEINKIINNYKENLQSQNSFLHIPAQLTDIDFDFSKSSYISENQFAINRSGSENTNNVPWDANLSVGDTHDFAAATSDNKTNLNYAKNAVLKKIGQHCYVWYVSKDKIEVNNQTLNNLADKFDSIYEKETFIFGTNKPGINNSSLSNSIIDFSNLQENEKPKVHIIVYDIFDDYKETSQSGVGTFGYFWSLDFWKNTTLQNFTWKSPNDQTNYKQLKSNECECIHLDSYFLSVVPDMVYSTIGHEFQHLLHFVNKSLNTAKSNDTKLEYSLTWFNEMMSMVCEDIMLTQLGLQAKDGPQSRLELFNQTYDWGFGNWYTGDYVYISYANAYAFGAFLLRNYGIEFIKELAANRYKNETAVVEACKARNISGINNFNDILHLFYKAILNPKSSTNSLNNSVSATYSINGNSITFNCGAINLFDYITIPKNKMTLPTSLQLYQGVFFQDYYGPVIYNNTKPKDIGSKGSCIIHLNGLVAGNKLIDESWNTNLKYYLVITENK